MTNSKLAKFTVVKDNFHKTPKDRFLRLPAVLEMTGVQKSKLYTWMKDGIFPRPINLGGRTVAWPESQVIQWIENKKNGQKAPYVIKDSESTKTNSNNNPMYWEETRLTVASMALQGLLSNPNLKSEILKSGGVTSGWLESSAVGFADALIGELAK